MSMTGLSIRTDPCALDFLALGALVHRLDPGVIPFRKARSLEVHVSGGEYNVAANLSDCFKLRTGIATAMVNYGIGELVQSRVRETGVTPFYKWFEHDGVRGPNIATVYSDRGHGVRAPVVFYNRANEAGALLKPGDFDWKTIFARGVRWFHSGGIFAALSETTSELIIEGMQAAKAAGAITSFDLNYRAKLWASVGGAERGVQVIKRIVTHVDALIGNDLAGSALDQPSRLGGRLVAGRPAVREPYLSARRHRPDRGRRRLRRGPHFRPDLGTTARGGSPPGLGPRCAVDDLLG